MTLVWDKFEGSGSELLAMLAMTDWCNDSGGSLHPSIDTLAKKIRVSESQARRLLRKLMADGFISVVGNEYGGAPGMSRHYRVHVEKLRAMPDINPTGGADDTGSTDATGSMGARDGSHGCAETGSTGATQTTTISTIEPPLKEKRGKKTAEVITVAIPEWVPAQPWSDYIAMRAEKKKAPTNRAVELLIAALKKMVDAGQDIAEVLNASTRNGWTDVYPVRAQAGAAQAPSERGRTSYDRTSDIALAEAINAARGVKPLTDDSNLDFND